VSAPGSPHPLLLADIGGTNARLAWVAHAQAGIEQVQTLPVAAHRGPAQAVQTYLQGLQRELGARFQPPASAALAVATPVAGDAVRFTNSAWSFSIEALRRELGLAQLVVVNDFEALARALPGLGPAQWRRLGGPPPRAAAEVSCGTVLAVLGPGTGLGVAAVLRTRNGWQALPAEGGHATLAAADALQAEVIAHVRREYAHVSAERLLCGPGLVLLHAALAAVRGVPVRPAMTPAQIVAAAQQHGDELAGHTLDLFAAFLGGFAGNLALTLGARGGVFVGGGVVPRFADRVVGAGFRAHFEAKGRFAGYLAAIPTLLVTDTLAALAGARLAADEGN
jgi:glucokinase